MYIYIYIYIYIYMYTYIYIYIICGRQVSLRQSFVNHLPREPKP